MKTPSFSGTLLTLGLALAVVSHPQPSQAVTMTEQQVWLGEVVADQFGIATAPIGDVNGDYHEDFLVGANVNDAVVQSGGQVYLYLGGATYPTGAAGTFAGNIVRGYVGGAVAGAADINGDLYDDFVVGAPGLGPDDQHPGRVYVFLGGPTPDLVPDAILEGSVAAGQFGQAVALIPDWNGDGYADLAVGAPRAGNGQVAIYLGGPGGITGPADIIIHARPSDSRFGKSLAWLADRNADQISELLIGAPRSFEAATWAGAVLLLDGSAALDTIPDLVLLGAAAGDEFGTSLSAAADADGDGQPDILVGAPFANPNLQTDAGSAYLFGTTGGLDNVPDLTLNGSQLNEHFGFAVALGFDWDDDGQPDIAVGVPDRTSGGLTYAGEVEIHLGGTLVDAIADDIIVGSDASLHLGTSVTQGGDLQGSYGTTLCAGGYNAINAGQVMVYGRQEIQIAPVLPVAATDVRLAAPWPNPANPATALALTIAQPGTWQVGIYDLRGRLVKQLHSGYLNEGSRTWRWQGQTDGGQAAASGLYLVRAANGEQQLVRRFSIVR